MNDSLQSSDTETNWNLEMVTLLNDPTWILSCNHWTPAIPMLDYLTHKNSNTQSRTHSENIDKFQNSEANKRTSDEMAEVWTVNNLVNWINLQLTFGLSQINPLVLERFAVVNVAIIMADGERERSKGKLFFHTVFIYWFEQWE